jgi:hypothetical protein
MTNKSSLIYLANISTSRLSTTAIQTALKPPSLLLARRKCNANPLPYQTSLAKNCGNSLNGDGVSVAS